MAAIVMDNIRRLSFSYPSTEKIPGFDDADLSSETSSRHSFKIGSAAADIDIDHINKSLDHVNNFSKRRMTDKLPPVLMYEIGSTGESYHKSMTLRELLNYVNDEANEIDDAAYLKEIIEINMREEAEMLKQDAKREHPFQNEKPPARRPSPQRTSESKSHHTGSIAEQSQPPQARKSTNLSHLAAAKPIYESRYGAPLRAIDEDREQVEETYESIGALRLRDLRRLDFQFNPNEERSVLIRRHSVLFAMDPIRAVVMAKCLILIVPDGADSLLSILDRYMKEWVTAKEQSKEAAEAAALTEQAAAGNSAATSAAVPVTINGGTGTSASSPTPSPTSDGSPTIPEYPAPLTKGPPKHHSMSNLFRKMSVNIVGGLSQDHKDQTPHHLAHHKPHRVVPASSVDLPFEMHAYEALLTTVMALETQEFNRVNAQVQIILNYFRSGSLLPIEVQEKMRNCKNDLSVMIRRIQSARATINVLTEDDEEMALMNLSLLRDKPALYHLPLKPEILTKHDEMEELLESYLIDFNALESKIDLTRNQIQNAEDLLSLRLDTSRNELLIANTILAILACCFGLGAYVSGIFGMNLDNTGKLQETKNVFYIVIATSFGGMFLMFIGLIMVFRQNGMFPAKIALHNRDAIKLK